MSARRWVWRTRLGVGLLAALVLAFGAVGPHATVLATHAGVLGTASQPDHAERFGALDADAGDLAIHRGTFDRIRGPAAASSRDYASIGHDGTYPHPWRGCNRAPGARPPRSAATCGPPPTFAGRAAISRATLLTS